ncbi:hypothetical protein [Streptomyces boninensis]|uniref:hypothetical protein n=1 Tax=Streptomyces boninensis TaxID=2039455 RepID=UPI003B215CFC
MRSGHLTALAAAALLAVPAAVATPAAAATTTPAWEVSVTGDDPRVDHLSSITSARGGAAWAAGLVRPDGVARSVMLRWDGHRWAEDTTPGLPRTGNWNTVSAASARDVWAYGWDQEGEVAAHYDGRRWQDTQLPRLPDDGWHNFHKLAAVPGKAWLAGGRWISTYENGRWSATDTGADHDIASIHARSARDAWAVGSYNLPGVNLPPLVMHWDGRSWKDVELPRSDQGLRLTSVYAESARSVWAAGFVSSLEDGYEPKVLHWDGRSWTDATGPVADLGPQAVSGDGRGRVWLSGDENGFEDPPVFWRHDKRGWKKVPGAAAPGDTHGYFVNGLAPAGHGRMWASGAYSRVIGEGTAEDLGLIERSRRR